MKAVSLKQPLLEAVDAEMADPSVLLHLKQFKVSESP